MATTNDIRKTGPQSYRDLQRQNTSSFEEELPVSRFDNWQSSGPVVTPSSLIYEGTESSPLQQMGEGDYWGRSRYDNPYANSEDFLPENLNDTRYENQPWTHVLANGVGKMLGTAATTFASSLVGLPYGLFEAARTGQWSALWNNEVTQALGDVDDWMEKNMTNYKSQRQQESPWYDSSNLLSMNQIADDLIKNFGFTLGAASSMAVGSGALGLMSGALKITDAATKVAKPVSNILAALYSATGEGMIEARQGVEERNKLELQKLNDALAPEEEALNMELQQIQQEYEATRGQSLYMTPEGRGYDPAYLRKNERLADWQERKNALDQKRAAGEQQIEESGKKMGNKILLFNQALLSAGDLIQFSKGMAKSFDSARHAAAEAAKNAKPFGVTAKRVSKDLADGYKVVGKNFGRTAVSAKNFLKEASEEMNQQWVQSSSGAAYNEQDVNDYWRARLNPEAYRETTKGLYTWGQILDRGFDESWGDFNQWQQFFIGGFTGLAGSYMPSKIFNQDKTKSRLDPRRYGSWEGGIIQDVKDFNRQYKQYEENVEELNKILEAEEFPTRLRSMVGHTSEEMVKEAAAEADDKKAWKDADDKQMIHDVQAFIRAGKLNDLRAIYNELGKNLSDEDIEGIVKSTTKEVDDGDGKKHYEGIYVDSEGNRTATNDEIREIAKHNAEELNRKLDSYLASIDYVQKATRGTLTKDQEDNLAYLHNMAHESSVRMDKIMADVRKDLPKKFLLKTDKTPEQLTREYATSDLVFSKDENTQKGYVEVDTSLMRDTDFARFFQTNIIMGGNIREEFGETAEERAAREEEEKNLSDAERKAKARERASKKHQEELERLKEDAKEQRDVNTANMEKAFVENYRKNNPNASKKQADDALNNFWQNITDAWLLFYQAGMYNATLNAYMNNPSLIDRDKEKEEKKAEKEEAVNQTKNKFAGKTASQINQDIANGTVTAAEVDDFAGVSLGELDDVELGQAQQAAKQSQEIRQKAAALKNHVQEALGDNPTAQQVAAAEATMKAIDEVALNADNAAELGIEDIGITAEAFGGNPKIIPIINEDLAGAFNSLQQDEDAQEDIPQATEIQDVEAPAPATGKDDVSTVPAETVAPENLPSSEAAKDVVPENPLDESAIDDIIDATHSLQENDNEIENKSWRSNTSRFGRTPIEGKKGYRMADKPYHEIIGDTKNPVLYKRSKAIWEYLTETGAFDRVESASKDKVKVGDTIHLMVKYLPDVYGKSFGELTDAEKPYSLVILMLNDNGEILGDLPLAEFEPSFRDGKPSNHVVILKGLQDKVFTAFAKNYEKTGSLEAMVDTMQREGADNLNLTYKNGKPLVSSISQVMRGAVPYVKGQTKTLNEVAGDAPMTLGIRVDSGRVVISRGDRNIHKDFKVPSVGNTGQVYMLLPTASGDKFVVPFYTKPFDAERHKNTEFYKTLKSTVAYLLKSNDSSLTHAQRKDYFQKHMEALKGLLQVDSTDKTIEVGKDIVSLHLRSLTNPKEFINITVPKTGKAEDTAEAIVKALSGIKINVSLEYINKDMVIGIADGERKSSSYNRLIGEIADMNLPENTQHSVNNWFTINLNPEAKKAVPIKSKTFGKHTEVIGGRQVEIDLDNIDTVFPVDASTGEIITDDEAVFLRMAQLKSEMPVHQGKPRIQITINGTTRTYSVAEKKFVKPVATETPASQTEQGNPTFEGVHDVFVAGPAKMFNGTIQETKPAEKTDPVKEPMTLEQIDKSFKNSKRINSQNMQAWNTIPDTLKLKMVNDGIPLQLSYEGKNVILTTENMDNLKRQLIAANNAARKGTLKVSEAPKPMEKDNTTLGRENEREARKWLTKNLPTLSSEERVQFVDTLRRMGDNAGKAWGSYRGGVIEIQRNAPMGTVYHEAFHYVLDIVLSPEERKQVLDAAKKEYGEDLSYYAAEERLANDFRRYAMDENATGIVGTIKRWIRKIKDKITRYSKISDPTINQLFWKINNGEMGQKAVAAESFEKTQQIVLREIRNAQKDIYQWNNLDADTRETLKSVGLTKDTYQNMSLEEQQQYVKCMG